MKEITKNGQRIKPNSEQSSVPIRLSNGDISDGIMMPQRNVTMNETQK
jgi:hypothetical protein